MGSLFNKRTDKPVLFCCAQEQCVKSRAFSRTWGIKYSKLMLLQYISRWSRSVVHKDEIRQSPTRKVWRGHYMNVWFSSHYISFFSCIRSCEQVSIGIILDPTKPFNIQRVLASSFGSDLILWLFPTYRRVQWQEFCKYCWQKSCMIIVLAIAAIYSIGRVLLKRYHIPCHAEADSGCDKRSGGLLAFRLRCWSEAYK